MRIWECYPACPDCGAEAGKACWDRRNGRRGQTKTNPCYDRIRFGGGDRWAIGDELTCGAGGCRNLATYILRTSIKNGTEQFRRL